MLPFQEYTNPVSGMLNLTTALPEYRCRPDIGPKTYLGTGRMEEKNDGTDSVTHLHLDMTDAFNVLLHAQEKNPDESKFKILHHTLTFGLTECHLSFRDCAAVWSVVARKDVATVAEYFRNPNVISERKTYLRAVDREMLVDQHDARIWTFAQYENDAVYVPSGCPHQVRNTRSCLKVIPLMNENTHSILLFVELLRSPLTSFLQNHQPLSWSSFNIEGSLQRGSRMTRRRML